MHFIFWCIFLPFLFFSSTQTRSKISSHWDALTKSYITVFTLFFSFLFLGSNETETHIYMLKNSNIKPELLTRYASKFFSLYVCYRFWEFALGIDQLNYHYYAIYDKLKGYGINKEVIESEGVYGIFILTIWSFVGEISRDVGRTFPLHPLFREERGIGQQMLENVLQVIAEYVNSIGYCQVYHDSSWGFSREWTLWQVHFWFVKLILLFSTTVPLNKEPLIWSKRPLCIPFFLPFIHRNSQVNIEKRVFRLFVYIINTLQMTRLWSSGIPGLKLYTYILQYYAKYSLFFPYDLHRIYVPELCKHFDEIGFDLSIFVTKWFLTLFAYVLTVFSIPIPIRIFPFLFSSKSGPSSFWMYSFSLFLLCL